MAKPLDISIINVAFYEPKSMPKFIDWCMQAGRELDKLGYSWEIVTVHATLESSGKDETRAVMEKIAAKNKKVRLVFAPPPSKGKGHCLKLGMKAARGKVFALIDTDLQNDPRDIPGMLEKMQREDLAFVLSHRVNRVDPWWRLFISKFYNAYVSLLFGLPIKDAGSQPRLFRAKYVNPDKIKTHRFLIEIEIPWMVYKNGGTRSAVMPVKHYERKTGKSAVKFSTPFQMGWDALKLRVTGHD